MSLQRGVNFRGSAAAASTVAQVFLVETAANSGTMDPDPTELGEADSTLPLSRRQATSAEATAAAVGTFLLIY